MRTVIGLFLAGLASTPALAVGRLADVTVVDRDTGETLQTHYHRGEYWVAGRPGARYSLQIQNRDGRRLLAVTSVDGVNVLTGETAAIDQRGYVFDPWLGYGIAGWRKSDSEIAAFTFTSIPKSYAARTGRPDNVGVIGVALFRERLPPQQLPQISQAVPPAPRLEMSPPALRGDLATEQFEEVESAAARAAGQAKNSASDARAALTRPAAPSLGTGHGQREYSSVINVAFERERAAPDEVIRIRYDSQVNLVAMGIVPPPPRKPRQVDPFPRSPQLGYVPDP
jgi:hypothetical protein